MRAGRRSCLGAVTVASLAILVLAAPGGRRRRALPRRLPGAGTFAGRRAGADVTARRGSRSTPVRSARLRGR